MSLLLEQQDPHWHVTGPVCGGGIQTREVYCTQSVPAAAALRAKEGRQPVPGQMVRCWLRWCAAGWKENLSNSSGVLLEITDT